MTDATHPEQHDGGHGKPEHAERGDEKARKRDPSGTHSGNEAHPHEPAGVPTSDRHKTESVGGGAGAG